MPDTVIDKAAKTITLTSEIVESYEGGVRTVVTTDVKDASTRIKELEAAIALHNSNIGTLAGQKDSSDANFDMQIADEQRKADEATAQLAEVNMQLGM